jgi:hypothetical protein
MKNLLVLSLLICGCANFKVDIAQPKPNIPTTQPISGAVFSFSKDLDWTKESCLLEAQRRFNQPIVVIIDSKYNDKAEWIAIPDNDSAVEMNEFALSLCLKYRESDIVIFSNNPQKSKLGAPRVWYFEENVFTENRLSSSIWKAVTQWGFRLEK